MKLHIKNYQIIRDAEITVDGPTLIVGSNDQGKSSIKRAVNGLILSQSGSDFIRHGTSRSHVELASEGDSIVWEKPKSSGSEYNINGKEFDKIGRGRFEELDKYGLAPIKAGPDEFVLQIIDQFNPLILFGKPDTRKFQVISSILDYDKFESAIDDIKTDKKQVSEEIKSEEAVVKNLEDQIETHKEEVEIYQDFFDDYPESFVEGIEQKQKKGEEIFSTVEQIIDKQEEHNSIRIPPIDLQNTKQSLEQIKVGIEQYTDIQSIIEELAGKQDQLNELKKYIDLFENAVFDIPESGINKIGELEDLLDNLSGLENEVDQAETKLQEQQQQKEEIEQEMNQLEDELEICPLCGQGFE